MEPLTCAAVQQALADYLDEATAAALCAAIEQHLTACEACRWQVATLRKTVGVCQHLPQPVFPPPPANACIKRYTSPPLRQIKKASVTIQRAQKARRCA